MTIAMNRQLGEGDTRPEVGRVRSPEVNTKVLKQGSEDPQTLNDSAQSVAVQVASAAAIHAIFSRANSAKGRSEPAPRCAYQLYELLKAHLTSNAENAREYELAVREAARLAGV